MQMELAEIPVGNYQVTTCNFGMREMYVFSECIAL